MTVERTIDIDGTEYPIVLSDDPKTLLAAKAAGRVVVGLSEEISACKASDKAIYDADKITCDVDETICDIDEAAGDVQISKECYSQAWLPVNFVAAGLPVDEVWLEGAVRRELGIPWNIAETDRLIIREFSVNDCGSIPDDADDSPDEAILKDPERLQTYINEQYAFFDCGMWALVRKEDGQVVGMVSLTPWSDYGREDIFRNFSGFEQENISQSMSDVGIPSSDDASEAKSEADVGAETDVPPGRRICELGYHIYTPYRRCGYAEEACRGIIKLLAERNICVAARADSANTPSVSLLKKLGFEQVSSVCFLRPVFV